MARWRARMVVLAAGLAALSFGLSVRFANAADVWPTKAIRIVVPFAPGATPDAIGRLLAERLQARLGVPVVIENKPGASGNTGTDAVAKAEPDGSTLGISIVGPLVLNALLFPAMPYDAATDLAPLTIIGSQPNVLVVSNGFGVATMADLTERLKRDGASLNYGSIGYGSLSHLAMTAVVAAAGAKPSHIPYAGSPNVVTALIRGDIQMAVLAAGAVIEPARAGLLKMVAVTSPHRSPLMPELPTFRESGYAGVEADAWVGLIAPSRTPADVQARIVAEVRAALAEPGLREALRAISVDTIAGSPDEFRALLKAESDRWAPIIRANDIRIGK